MNISGPVKLDGVFLYRDPFLCVSGHTLVGKSCHVYTLCASENEPNSISKTSPPTGLGMNFTQTNRDQSLNQNPPNLVTDSCAPDQTIITIRRYHRPLGPLLTAHLVSRNQSI